MKEVWILTSEHNDYDQHGRYFEAVFSKKPTLKQLSEYFFGIGVLGESSNVMGTVVFLEHLLGGGGRVDDEDVWYNLTKESFEGVDL